MVEGGDFEETQMVSNHNRKYLVKYRQTISNRNKLFSHKWSEEFHNVHYNILDGQQLLNLLIYSTLVVDFRPIIYWTKDPFFLKKNCRIFDS